ncbi:heterokaryon incompatibility protein-domain-containing protein, partial [Trametes meyenii]
YAILSHVWDNSEQTFTDLQELASKETSNYEDLSAKAHGCNLLAREYKLHWFWVDAPCIDQENSAELSEAISSMYVWYSEAQVCFAFLHDVPPGPRSSLYKPGSAFRCTIYFTRGWTLQELVAPRRVVFVAADWSVLGEKHDLADLLEEITGISADVLTFRRPVVATSVACRFSWASRRKTRRIEDEAYCLMGLFNIHIPIVYGQGHEVFVQLQECILARICDHTLFAW